MGDKKRMWAMLAGAVIAYALAANLMPLQESTVAVDRSWTVEGPHREFCADVSVTGDVTIARPFGLLRPAAVARSGRATLRDVKTETSIRECDGSDVLETEDGVERSAVVKVIIGDASCAPWSGTDRWSGEEPLTAGDFCADSAARMQLAGSAGQWGRHGWGDLSTVSTHRGCVDVSSQVIFSEVGFNSITTSAGDTDVERICPGDAS